MGLWLAEHPPVLCLLPSQSSRAHTHTKYLWKSLHDQPPPSVKAYLTQLSSIGEYSLISLRVGGVGVSDLCFTAVTEPQRTKWSSWWRPSFKHVPTSSGSSNPSRANGLGGLPAMLCRWWTSGFQMTRLLVDYALWLFRRWPAHGEETTCFLNTKALRNQVLHSIHYFSCYCSAWIQDDDAIFKKCW